jgi:hypothetical protein
MAISEGASYVRGTMACGRVTSILSETLRRTRTVRGAGTRTNPRCTNTSELISPHAERTDSWFNLTARGLDVSRPLLSHHSPGVEHDGARLPTHLRNIGQGLRRPRMRPDLAWQRLCGPLKTAEQALRTPLASGVMLGPRARNVGLAAFAPSRPALLV